MQNSGIYKISNVITSDFYIGSSQELTRRWSRHKYDLRNGVHANTILQRAWNKYGEAAFVFEVLTNAVPEELLRIENEYLDRLKPVYNIALDASAPMRGRRHTDEVRGRLASALIDMNMKNKDANVKRLAEYRGINGKLASKPIIQLSLSGDVIAEYDNSRAIPPEFRRSAVIRCCHGKLDHYKQFKWRYKNDSDLTRHNEMTDETKEKISISKRGRGHSDVTRELLRSMKPKRRVASFNLETGDTVKVYERTKQVKDDGFSQARVVLCCQGKAHTHGGLGWKYLS